MRTRALRFGFAMLAFLAIVQWSSPAYADVSITGTVGELSLFGANVQQTRFKMTNVALTQTCVSAPGSAYINHGEVWYREYYAMLLVSKKGSQITCTVDNNTNCHVTSCTLP